MVQQCNEIHVLMTFNSSNKAFANRCEMKNNNNNKKKRTHILQQLQLEMYIQLYEKCAAQCKSSKTKMRMITLPIYKVEEESLFFLLLLFEMNTFYYVTI